MCGVASTPFPSPDQEMERVLETVLFFTGFGWGPWAESTNTNQSPCQRHMPDSCPFLCEGQLYTAVHIRIGTHALVVAQKCSWLCPGVHAVYSPRFDLCSFVSWSSWKPGPK